MTDEQRVVLVTGATQNTGRTIAAYFALRGDTVLVNARDPEAVDRVVAEIEMAGGHAEPAVADVSDPDAVQAVVDAALAAHGRVDVLVHSATRRHHAPIVDLTFEEWSGVLATTLTGAFVTARAVAAPMLAQRSGSIVFIGGHSAHSGTPGGAATTAAKSGLFGLTKSVARDLAAAGVTVNCLSPGFVRTDRDGDSDVRAGGRVPLGRFGTQEEIAASTYFLAGPDARYITGQVISVNGGVYM